MSETTQSPAVEEPREVREEPRQEALGESLDDEGIPEADRRASRQAAAYRRQLREVEAERDSVQARITALQRQQVERLASERLAVGADLFDIGGADLANLLNDDGDLDETAVTAALDELLKERPRLERTRPPQNFGQGRLGSSSAHRPEWGSVLRGE